MPIRRIAAALAGLKTALGITSPSREILDDDPGFFLRREAEAMVDARARYAA